MESVDNRGIDRIDAEYLITVHDFGLVLATAVIR